MLNVKVKFNTDAAESTQDITEEINIPSNTCLHCLNDIDSIELKYGSNGLYLVLKVKNT